MKSGPKSYEHLKLKRQVPEKRKSIGGVEVKEREVKRYTWVVGEKKKKKDSVPGWWEKKERKKENNNNKI